MTSDTARMPSPAAHTTTSDEKGTNTLCRICATSGSGNLFSIFSQEGELWDVAEKIGRCLPIIVLPTDKLPLNICVRCLMKLNTSYELVITALNSEAKLKAKYVSTEETSKQVKTLQDGHVKRTLIKQEVSDNDVKENMIDDVEELPAAYVCEVVSSVVGNEEVKVGDFLTLKSDCIEYKEETQFPGTTIVIKDVVSLREQSDNCKEDVTKRKNVELVVNNHSEARGQILTAEVPSLTIYGPATCDLCDVLFTDMDEFDNHIVNLHLKKHKWQCMRCDDSFEHSQDLVLHKAVTHEEEPISCGRCNEKKIKDENTGDEGIEEEWLEETEAHVDENRTCAINHSKDKSELYCKICDKDFSTESKLKDHYLVHMPRALVCNRCGLKCSSFFELSVHKKTHLRNVKEKRFTCDVCRKAFSERVLFNIHRRHCGSKQYICNLCDRTFWREYSFQLHVKVHNQDEKVYLCECGEKFDGYKPFQNHKKTHERQGEMKCVTCNKVFTNETFYKRHRYIHDPEYWDRFKCQTCQRPFRDAHALKNHMQLHAGIKPHMCDLCGRTYNRFTNMLKHRKLHKPQNLWEHNCTKCEAKFERLKDLMTHIDHVHCFGDARGEDKGNKKTTMKWICRFCGKRISTKLSLQDHERIHTGAKPYICEWCGREFRSRPNLLQHHLTHTGDRKHACGICGKKFARKSFIAQHMRVHTGEKPFECDLCNKRFTQAGDMRRHRNRHTQQQKEQDDSVAEIKK